MKPLTTRKELKKREFLMNAKALMQDRMILAKEIFIWRFTPKPHPVIFAEPE